MADPIEDDHPPAGIAPPIRSIASNAKAFTASNARSAPALDRSGPEGGAKTGVVQPKPQAIAKRAGSSAILVSPRQNGNPILKLIRSLPWEYSDMPADYVLGLTTCCLFLSLKYHRLHPEYIYTRIKGLAGKYLLRIILVMVDITNHEESLRELSKTSLINNVTLILCWSAAEGARYLELFKTYENAAPTAIKQHQSSSYSDRMVDFITTPRSINKTDAVSLVSQFGSVKTAVNAGHESVSSVPGWGEKKVERWCKSVREPFRVQRASKRGLVSERSILTQPISRAATLSREATRAEGESTELVSSRENTPIAKPQSDLQDMPDNDADQRPQSRLAEQVDASDFVEDDDIRELVGAPVQPALEISSMSTKKRKNVNEDLNDGVMAALSKLRKPD